MTGPVNTEREIDSADRMSDHEALMWNIEKDPWLNPSGAGMFVFDQPIDVDRLRARMRVAVARLPRLYQRVQPGFGRLSTPAWVPDPEFDFEFHFRVVRLPSPGTERQLLDLASTLYMEPLDRTRPLWRMVVIDGLESGRGALWSIMHHSISDGIGQLRMAEMFQDLEREVERAPDIDLEGIVAAAAAGFAQKEAGGDLGSSLAATAVHSATHLLRRSVGTARRAAGEVVLWPADPTRATEAVGDIAALVRSTAQQLASPGGEGVVGAPLFHERSRHRHLETVRVSLDDLKVASKAAGATVNDAFVAVMADATSRYHEERNAPFDTLIVSFVISTRTDDKAGGNAFTPVAVSLPAGYMSIHERLAATHGEVVAARESASRGGGITALSGVLNLLPTSVVTRTARAQAAKIDIATSNLRGAPFALYIGGAEVLYSVTMGPLAGTPCNATALSYCDSFDIGLFIDPVAIKEPAAFRDCVEAAFADLLA
jgi:diacylglycerol O-acyltransferase / wax synthase